MELQEKRGASGWPNVNIWRKPKKLTIDCQYWCSYLSGAAPQKVGRAHENIRRHPFCQGVNYTVRKKTLSSGWVWGSLELGYWGKKGYIRALVCAPELICALVCDPKLILALVCAIVCTPKLACVHVCAPKLVCALVCAPKLVCAPICALAGGSIENKKINK